MGCDELLLKPRFVAFMSFLTSWQRWLSGLRPISRSVYPSLDPFSVLCHILHSRSAVTTIPFVLIHLPTVLSRACPFILLLSKCLFLEDHPSTIFYCSCVVEIVNEVFPFMEPAFVFIFKWEFSSDDLPVSGLPTFSPFTTRTRYHLRDSNSISFVGSWELHFSPTRRPLGLPLPFEKRCSQCSACEHPPVDVCELALNHCSFSRM